MATKQIPLTCPGHTRPVVDLNFSEETPHGYFMISACKDGKPMLRHGHTGDWIGTFEGHKGAVWGSTLNKDATLAATGAADFTAKLWDGVKGTESVSFAHKHIVKSVNFSQDDGKLLTGSNEKKMRIFDLKNPEKEAEIISGLGGNPKACLFANNDQSIFSGGDEKVLRQWDARTLSEVNSITLTKSVMGMQLSSDRSVLCVASGNKVAFYDTTSFSLVKEFEMKADIYSVSLSPDKSCFVAGGEDFILYKCNYDDGKETDSYHGHFGPVHCVHFSPDGELYASGSEDGTLRLWQTNVGKTYGLWRAPEETEEEQKTTPAKDISINHVNEISVES